MGNARDFKSENNRIVFAPAPNGTKSTTYLFLVDTNYEEAYVHWWKSEDGKWNRVVCAGGLKKRGKAPDVCEVCKAVAGGLVLKEFSTNHGFFMNALQGKAVKNYESKKLGKTLPIAIVFDDKKVKLIDRGWSIFSGITTVLQDEEDTFDEKTNAIKVTRTGSTKNDTEYTTQKCQSPVVKKFKMEDIEDVNDLTDFIKPTPVETIKEMLGIARAKDDDGDDDDFEVEGKKEKKEKVAKKPKDDDEDVDDVDDDEDEKPKKGKKTKDDDDDDEDEKPKKGKKDDEDLDDDDDEDEKPKKKSKADDDDDDDEDEKPKKGKKSKDDDDDDDLSDDDDEDEKPAKKKAKDDDDDDEDEKPKKKSKADDDNDDDEDEKPKKGKKSKDDDDDFDLDDDDEE